MGSVAAVAGLDGRIRVVDLDTMRVSVVDDVASDGSSRCGVHRRRPARHRLRRRRGDRRSSRPSPSHVDSRLPPGFANRAIAQAGPALVTAGDSGMLAMDAASGAVAWRQDSDGRGSACTSLTAPNRTARPGAATEAGEIVEHDLATGSSTAVFPQRAAEAFLSADGTELVIVGVEEPVFSRWGLDGRGAMTRVIASGSTGAVGYSPDGSAVIVADRSARLHVWDARTDASRLVLPATATRVVWAGDDLLLAGNRFGDPSVLLDASSGELLPGDGVPDLANNAWVGASGRRLVIAADDERSPRARPVDRRAVSRARSISRAAADLGQSADG